MSNTLNQTPPLDFPQINQAAAAFTRFVELREQTVATPTSEAEIRGLAEFLSTFFINHAAEFLGNWITVRTEYQPLVQVLSPLFRRVHGFMNHQAAAQAEAQAKQAKATETVDSAEPKGKIIQLHP